MDTSRYFEVQFASKNLSTRSLLDFSHDHLHRMAGQNADGQHDDLLADTASRYEALGGKDASEQTKLAIQKARTSRKTARREAIHQQLSRLEGGLHGVLNRTSPEYLEFFPLGLSELRRAPEAGLLSLLERLVSAADVHAPDKKQDFMALRDDWKTVYDAASEGRAATRSSGGTRAQAKEALQLQLTRNLHLLGLYYLGRPEMAGALFDTSRLKPREKSETAKADTQARKAEADALRAERRAAKAETDLRTAAADVRRREAQVRIDEAKKRREEILASGTAERGNQSQARPGMAPAEARATSDGTADTQDFLSA